MWGGTPDAGCRGRLTRLRCRGRAPPAARSPLSEQNPRAHTWRHRLERRGSCAGLIAIAVLFVPGVVSARLTGIPWFSALGIAARAQHHDRRRRGRRGRSSRAAMGACGTLGDHGAWSGPRADPTGRSASWGRCARRSRQPRTTGDSSDRGRPARTEAGTAPGGDGPTRARASTSGFSSGLCWRLAGMHAIAVAVVLVQVSGSPEAFPQHPDTIFHLGTAQWMAEHRDVSVLHASGFMSATGTGAYPAAFHAMTATVTMLIAGFPRRGYVVLRSDRRRRGLARRPGGAGPHPLRRLARR